MMPPQEGGGERNEARRLLEKKKNLSRDIDGEREGAELAQTLTMGE